jgi:hypothetical protein
MPNDQAMSIQLDISEIAAALSALEANPAANKLAVVIPIDAGSADIVRDYVAEGPPFDLRSAGIVRHEVFLAEQEVIFVFETSGGIRSLERILSDSEFWEAIKAWEHIIRERPRVAGMLLDWHA